MHFPTVEAGAAPGGFYMRCGRWSWWLAIEPKGDVRGPWLEVRRSVRGDTSVYIGRLELTWGRDGKAAVSPQSA